MLELVEPCTLWGVTPPPWGRFFPAPTDTGDSDRVKKLAGQVSEKSNKQFNGVSRWKTTWSVRANTQSFAAVLADGFLVQPDFDADADVAVIDHRLRRMLGAGAVLPVLERDEA